MKGSIVHRRETKRPYCNVTLCNGSRECYEDDLGRDYRGTVSKTNTGRKCQKWTSELPHGHGFLRSPDYTIKGGLFIKHALKYEKLDLYKAS